MQGRAWRVLSGTPPLKGRGTSPNISLITYNILADVYAMTKKHAYCPAHHRAWDDSKSHGPGRLSRLAQELNEYRSDVLCLQECSYPAFTQLGMKLDGYQGVHASSVLVERSLRDRKKYANALRNSETGLAIFCKSGNWKPIAARSIRLSALLVDSVNTFQIPSSDKRWPPDVRRVLSKQDDSTVLMQLLEHEATNLRLLMCTTHLFWDPRFPHVKASQADLVCLAIRHFAEESMAHSSKPLAIVLAGDLNSTPHLQPAFLPSGRAEALPQPLPDAWRNSATYELLSTGSVASEHPEHPDSFSAQLPDGWHIVSAANRPKHVLSPDSIGMLSTHGLSWQDAYHDALSNGPLPITTHADNFAGCLDYIWVGLGGDWGGESTCLRDGRVTAVLDVPYDVTRPDSLGKIPDATWPSDHLALGVDISFDA